MTDILSILEEYGVDHRSVGEHHHATGGFVQTHCPKCSPDDGFQVDIPGHVFAEIKRIAYRAYQKGRKDVKKEFEQRHVDVPSLTARHGIQM
jgi:hypothetical protein